MIPRYPLSYSDYQNLWANHQARLPFIAAYSSGESSFIPALLPEQAVNLSTPETLSILRSRFGSSVSIALNPTFTRPTHLIPVVPAEIQSPVSHYSDGTWLKSANMVGINVRTIQNFWNIIKYALTLPAIQNSIHILPIWEPGVVSSLYGISSWQINREFFSPELSAEIPHLNTVEKQLKAVINILHLMGRTVGMDIIPHTDRFSEIVLANPAYFEWLQRDDTVITNHTEHLHRQVESAIYQWLCAVGTAYQIIPIPPQNRLFSPLTPENIRLRILFGLPKDQDHRRYRRIDLIRHLRRLNYEPVPATMAPPFRGIEVDPSPEAYKIDENGLEWREFRISRPEGMSRVFGPLTRYKLYSRKDDNSNWEIDFSRPRTQVWDYVKYHYSMFQARYGFDFMRGDMSHVQMRPDGVPHTPDRYYDLLGSIKKHIQDKQGVRTFGYFAESFLAPPNVMGYGAEEDHLEASFADTTLGNLQSMVVGSDEFLANFRDYLGIADTRTFKPNFTIFTSDKDDPRFDAFYLKGNALRLFIAFFLPDLPSYSALGFYSRDPHPSPAPNEHYTKLFVFQERSGPKATHGPYIWGCNITLFNQLSRLKHFADSFPPIPASIQSDWLIPPDPESTNKCLVWNFSTAGVQYIFLANADLNAPNPPGQIIETDKEFRFMFSTDDIQQPEDNLSVNNNGFLIPQLQPGECQIYYSN